MAETVYDVRASRLNRDRYRLTLRPKGSRVQGRPVHGELWARKTKPAAYILIDSQGEDAAAEYRDKQMICPRCGKAMKFSHVFIGQAMLPTFECERCAVDAENNIFSVL